MKKINYAPFMKLYLGHIDMDTRKTAEMTGAFFDNLHRIMLQHTKADIGIPLRLQIKEL